MSKDLTIDQRGSELVISYDWRTRGLWFFVIFTVIWNAIVLAMLFTPVGIFALFHLLLGLFLLWFTATRFLNRTTLTVDRRELRIEHGPLPWPFASNRRVPARSLRQLYVKRSNVKINNQRTYHLVGKLDTGAEAKLIKSQPDRAMVERLERTIETYLNIRDDPSLNEGKQDFSGLDLDELREQMDKLEPLKKWLPRSLRTQMEAGRRRLEEAQARSDTDATEYGRRQPPRPRSAPPPTAPEEDVSLDQTWLDGLGGAPRDLPLPNHDLVFDLYRVRRGDRVTLHGRPYLVGPTAQLDFGEREDFGRQLQLEAEGGGEDVFVYGENERDRWSYYEERRLEDEEVNLLGFSGDTHPHRFENGTDRYYPRDRQEGRRHFGGGRGRAFEQFIYFSTGSQMQFRALRPEGAAWEVYVMEPVDGSAFATA